MSVIWTINHFFLSMNIWIFSFLPATDSWSLSQLGFSPFFARLIFPDVFQVPRPCALNGGKGRQYCFSDVPRKPNTVHSLLTELKWNIQVQRSPHQALIRLRHLQPFRFEVSDFSHLQLGTFPFPVSPRKFLSKVFLAVKIKNEGLLGTGLKFDKTNNYTLWKCKLLSKMLLYYTLREYRYFYFKYNIFCCRVWSSVS